MALLVELYSLRLVLSASTERSDWQAALLPQYLLSLLFLSFPHPSIFHFPFSLLLFCLSSVMGNARSLPQVIAFSRMQSNVLSLCSFCLILFLRALHHRTDNSAQPIFRDLNESSDHASVALLCSSTCRRGKIGWI